MELRLTSRQLRKTQDVSKKEQVQDQAASTASAGKQTAPTKTDRLSLSQQAAAYLREWNQKMQEETVRAAAEKSQGDDGTLDVLQKAIKAMKQCAEIARRITAGDKVPPEDEQFLMNNDPAGYKLAMATRKVKKDPKEWDSVLEDEKDAAQAASDPSGDSESDGCVSAASGSCGGGSTANC